MAVSVFDLFKIGIGPISSHTVGPMRAARLFVQRLAHEGVLAQTARVRCQLYGSLGATGKGHGSDKAVLLGLTGEAPDTVDVAAVPALLAQLRASRQLVLAGGLAIAFDEKTDLRFHRRESLPFHANGMRFTAFDAAAAVLSEHCYYSVGGGFVVRAMLNKSSRVWAPWFGMGCKAQTTAIAQLWRGFATLQTAQNRDDRAARDLFSVALATRSPPTAPGTR